VNNGKRWGEGVTGKSRKTEAVMKRQGVLVLINVTNYKCVVVPRQIQNVVRYLFRYFVCSPGCLNFWRGINLYYPTSNARPPVRYLLS
jgi:hypothetical protein